MFKCGTVCGQKEACNVHGQTDRQNDILIIHLERKKRGGEIGKNWSEITRKIVSKSIEIKHYAGRWNNSNLSFVDKKYSAIIFVK